MNAASVSFAEATRTWLRIGLLSFGGPAGQIALMHRILVEEKRWISEQRFLHALNYCMLLPGPEAQQLATYVGWLLHGIRGGLVAGILFVLPGFLGIMALSACYVLWQEQPLLSGVLMGLKAAVVALVLQALVRIASRALPDYFARALALLAFVGLAILHLPFPAIVLGAGLIGFLRARPGTGLDPREPATSSMPTAKAMGVQRDSRTPRSLFRSVKLLALGLPLWFAPVLASGAWLGTQHVCTQLGVFFSKMAVVTFGGAYAVLSYVAQQAVERFHWLTPQQMLDGLGLAETTPGPLILVVQFVGFLAAYQQAADGSALLAGLIGATLTVWVTFVPCFLWIFLGAPHVERLRENRALNGALAAITAAVVGVIANLALWFAVHVLFTDVSPRGWPALQSIQPIPALLTVAALLAFFAFRWNLGWCLAASMALGAALTPLI
jgi:chromate transporter